MLVNGFIPFADFLEFIGKYGLFVLDLTYCFSVERKNN